MRKEKSFRYIRFPAEVLDEASRALHDKTNTETVSWQLLSATVDDASWSHDTMEEFIADYRKSSGPAHLHKQISTGISMTVRTYTRDNSPRTDVEIEAPSRSVIESVFEIFEKYAATHPPVRPPLPKPRVFIGHGHDPAWRDLKDHLQDKQGYDVEAYETGARAGHHIRDILDDMLQDSDCAVLVLTGEDETREGELLARQNVIHELGLFQGRLGFSRGIMVVEEGTKEFSNMHGVQQIRFSKGNIREAFGDVLATLRRESRDNK